MTQPIFEIIDTDKHYKIWEDGKTEGFADSARVINRIYSVIAYYVNKAFEMKDVENFAIPFEYRKRIMQLFNREGS